MHYLLTIIIVVLSAIILLQDLRYKAVSWILFPVMAFSLVWNFKEEVYYPYRWTVFCNLTFLFIQFVFISLYLTLKHKRLVILTNGWLGWGDILFVVCLAAAFAPINFIAFYMISLLITLLLYLPAVFRTEKTRIPLAGIQSGIFLVLFLIAEISQVSFFDDRLILSFISHGAY